MTRERGTPSNESLRAPSRMHSTSGAAAAWPRRTTRFPEGPTMTLRTTQELWKIAWFDRTIRARVALELLASWPIPVRVTEQIQFRFFYYASFGPPPAKQFKLYPPCWEAWIAADGTVEKLHRI